ncbi:MAG: flippase-like domain-containing protein [Chloroflexia bacterium]|nr:flippase-like domain-containing protein [Chloroflexia bacterium]
MMELQRRFLNPRTLISFLVAAGLIALVVWQLDVDVEQVWTHMRQANPWLFGLAFLCFYLTFPLRAWRWKLLLEKAQDETSPPIPSFVDLNEILYLSWFANCVVPAKLGDIYRGYLLNRTSGANLSRTVGTIFAERVLDMLMLFLFLVSASVALFGPRIPNSEASIFVYGGGLGLALAAVGILLGLRFFGPTLRRWVPERFRDIYDRFLAGTLLSLGRRHLPLILLQSLAVWVLESLRFYFVVRSLPQDLPLGLPVIVFMALVSSLLTTLPLTPAGLGAVEAAFTGFLPFFLSDTVLDPQNLALAVALLDRLINYWSIVLLGGVLFLVSKKK